MATRPTRIGSRSCPRQRTTQPACHAALAEGDRLRVRAGPGPRRLWHHRLHRRPAASWPSATVEALRQAWISAAVGHPGRARRAGRTHRLFDAVGVRLGGDQGGHVRECVYPQSGAAPGPRHRHPDRACRPEACGASAHRRRLPGARRAATSTTRATFSRGASISTCTGPAAAGTNPRLPDPPESPAATAAHQGLLGLSDSDTLFHDADPHPAFNKYVCFRETWGRRAADLLAVDSNSGQSTGRRRLRLLERSGLETAAGRCSTGSTGWRRRYWTTLDAWIDTVSGEARCAQADPREWLERDLPSRRPDCRSLSVRLHPGAALRPGDCCMRWRDCSGRVGTRGATWLCCLERSEASPGSHRGRRESSTKGGTGHGGYWAGAGFESEIHEDFHHHGDWQCADTAADCLALGGGADPCRPRAYRYRRRQHGRDPGGAGGLFPSLDPPPWSASRQWYLPCTDRGWPWPPGRWRVFDVYADETVLARIAAAFADPGEGGRWRRSMAIWTMRGPDPDGWSAIAIWRVSAGRWRCGWISSAPRTSICAARNLTNARGLLICATASLVMTWCCGR